MRNVVIGFLGTQLDMGKRREWRPSVQLCAHSEFPVDRLELIHDARHRPLAEGITRAIAAVSPATEVRLVEISFRDPWDFQEVYGGLFDFARNYGFDEDRERYHVHLTTGTHVAQICWFLLTESRHIPAKLVQTGPPRSETTPNGTLDVIDLDLSRYNALQKRFDLAHSEYNALLKGGIESRNPAFNALIDRIELVATSSDAPILLLGEPGTGKTDLAARIYELKLQRRRVKGRLVHVNCATLRGAHALPTLFGQRRSVTGIAGTERAGLLSEANGGVLFLDEIDELGLDEQALLLHALETGRYYPLGSDSEVTSRFQVIAGANRDPGTLVAEGRLRPDLYARLNLWTFRLPPLRERREDLEANILHERAEANKRLGIEVGFNADAWTRYLRFARDPGTPWPGNFRDLSASVLRLSTLAARGRVTLAMIDEEIATLGAQWSKATRDHDVTLLAEVMENPDALDEFDRVQLAAVIRACRASPNLSAAGRRLFAASRAQKSSQNDADRLRKYLARFDIGWERIANQG
jgi:transcriptional regulatory protein RtcR